MEKRGTASHLLNVFYALLFSELVRDKQDPFTPWSIFVQTFFSWGMNASGPVRQGAFLLIKSLWGVSASTELKTRNYINYPQKQFWAINILTASMIDWPFLNGEFSTQVIDLSCAVWQYEIRPEHHLPPAPHTHTHNTASHWVLFNALHCMSGF